MMRRKLHHLLLLPLLFFYQHYPGIIGGVFGETSVLNQPNPIYGVPVYLWLIFSKMISLSAAAGVVAVL